MNIKKEEGKKEYLMIQKNKLKNLFVLKRDVIITKIFFILNYIYNFYKFSSL